MTNLPAWITDPTKRPVCQWCGAHRPGIRDCTRCTYGREPLTVHALETADIGMIEGGELWKYAGIGCWTQIPNRVDGECTAPDWLAAWAACDDKDTDGPVALVPRACPVCAVSQRDPNFKVKRCNGCGDGTGTVYTIERGVELQEHEWRCIISGCGCDGTQMDAPDAPAALAFACGELRHVITPHRQGR